MENCYDCNHCEVCRWIDKFKDKGVCDFYENESCGDAISRQSAISLASDLKQDLPDDEHMADMVMAHNEGILEYQTQLSLLSPVTPQPKKGHWITEDMFDGDVAYRCSECNELFWIESGTPKDNEYNFCPKCGARMRGEQDAE